MATFGAIVFTSTLTVRSKTIISTSLLLSLVYAEPHTLRKIYGKILGQTVRNTVFPLQPGETRAERWKWTGKQPAGNLND